jgi:hypothetical protein
MTMAFGIEVKDPIGHLQTFSLTFGANDRSMTTESSKSNSHSNDCGRDMI